MPEYLAPGVYVEETTFRAKSIEGVSTSTAGFVGPTRYGPVEGEPELVTSYADFERIYGGLDQLDFEGTETHNYIAHAVRAFFEEGGKRLYVARVFNGDVESSRSRAGNAELMSPPGEDLELVARFPGKAGDFRVTFHARRSDNVLAADRIGGGPNQLRGVKPFDTLFVQASGGTVPTGFYDASMSGDDLVFSAPGSGPFRATDLTATGNNPDRVFRILVDVNVEFPVIRPKRLDERYSRNPVFAEGFALHPGHANSLHRYYREVHETRGLHLYVPFFIETDADDGVGMLDSLLGARVAAALRDDDPSPEDLRVVYLLANGSDGALPGPQDYRGDEEGPEKSGFSALEDLEDISIVAAPGYSAAGGTDDEAIEAHLINHAHRMRYRVAILDSRPGQILGEIRESRGRLDSTHAALYYPWVRIADPVTEEEIVLPPSGFMAGIYARNDVERGVHKAPANEVVRMALGFETLINKGQQDVLNPLGINCLRFFEGRGFRVWGARTISSDPEWKYLNVRRYFAYLERSIDLGTQWAVFEPNGEALWAKVTRTIQDFLYNEWFNQRLLGAKPEEAYFVRCDRTTMTQNDLDNGRLVCLIGVCPLRPAEFVIFRIGQWTADKKS